MSLLDALGCADGDVLESFPPGVDFMRLFRPELTD
jgi:hypothetical protein